MVVFVSLLLLLVVVVVVVEVVVISVGSEAGGRAGTPPVIVRAIIIGIFRCPLFRGPLIISLCPDLALFSKMFIDNVYHNA